MIEKYVEALKRRLRDCGKDFTCDGDDDYANGDTECGFWPSTVVDFDALCQEIDAFTKEFTKEK
jgi:hypothetical protein